jgi:hypothetical protein
MNVQDQQQAAGLALAAVRKFPENAEAWVLKATALRLEGALYEAREAIQRSLLIQDTPEALIELLQVCIAQGNPSEVDHVSDMLSTAYPDVAREIFEMLEQNQGGEGLLRAE